MKQSALGLLALILSFSAAAQDPAVSLNAEQVEHCRQNENHRLRLATPAQRHETQLPAFKSAKKSKGRLKTSFQTTFSISKPSMPALIVD